MAHVNPNTCYWVRERSQKSVSMGLGSLPKTSLSAGTPDSLTDNEGGFRTPRKPSYRSALTPGGSRRNSRPTSRTGSRPGSKPPSRHGSNLSLDSTNDTPSRIPRKTPTSSGRSSALSTARKTTFNGTSSRPRTPSGLRFPASPAPRNVSTTKVRQVTIGVARTLRTASRTRTPSGSNTPVHPDQQTAVQRLLRRFLLKSLFRKIST
ncbi:uncharacterized protein LOC132702378 [Cylas formicarius]|uniref:uncharacterized protein LOC132702378 n=1 Tax=Cylas formicarius TaxID=197179 RepID=UPI0029587057|nr:uncharacterized protein LOC132702378 [Cylas formicarius]